MSSSSSDYVRGLFDPRSGLTDEAHEFARGAGFSSGDDLNAFRHAYSSAVVAQEWGETVSRGMGDLNEAKNVFKDISGDRDDKDDYIDKWNNELGIKIGEAVDKALGQGLISEDDIKKAIADSVAENMNDSKLMRSQDDPRIPKDPDWSDIKPSNVPSPSLSNDVDSNNSDPSNSWSWNSGSSNNDQSNSSTSSSSYLWSSSSSSYDPFGDDSSSWYSSSSSGPVGVVTSSSWLG